MDECKPLPLTGGAARPVAVRRARGGHEPGAYTRSLFSSTLTLFMDQGVRVGVV